MVGRIVLVGMVNVDADAVVEGTVVVVGTVAVVGKAAKVAVMGSGTHRQGP